MNPLQIVTVATRALGRNKLRSFLTALGVIIGVGAVIAMTAIGAGAKARVQETFEQIGSQMLVVRSGSSQMGGMRGGAGTQPTLTWDDMRAISEVRGVKRVAPMLAKPVQALAEGLNWGTVVQGTVPEYFEIRNWRAASGTLFDADDVARGAKVAVLGQTVVENLFGLYADPVGQIVRVDQVPFQVIGVAAERGQSAFGNDQDDVVLVPLSAYRSRIDSGLEPYIGGNIYVGLHGREQSVAVQTEIEGLLRERHRVRLGEPDDFSVRNMADLAAAQEEGARTMNGLLAGIALVSLVVGGIGIMNIMLVSVTERTREIGLRMAVGAKPRNILTQFLVEAVSLSLVGGLLGVGAGLGTAYWLVSRFEWPMLVQPQVVALSLGTSALVGIAFGLYPAWRASRLDPIQALRYE